MKPYFLPIVLLSLLSVACGKRPLYPSRLLHTLKPGDLVFQDLDCGDQCEAIERATKIPGFPTVTHVAVVEHVSTKKIMLIEALGKVHRISFRELVKRSRAGNGRSKIVIARFKSKHSPLIPFFLNELRMRLGKPYDKDFLPDNGAYYCSELVSDAIASVGVNLFPRHPMTFGRPGSWGRTIWEKYFKEHNAIIPEGVMGTNPNRMLSSNQVHILYTYKN